MNNNYYPNPSFPSNDNLGNNTGQMMPPSTQANFPLPTEQSYIENILRLNRGKVGTFYFTYPDSVDWRDRAVTGVIEASGRDHIIVSDPKDGRWYLLLLIYLDYVTFDERINYLDPNIPNV